MQTYDFLMLLVLGGMTLFGFAKGLAWQVAYVASLVVSYIVALRFSAQLAPRFGDTEPWNRFIAMLVIYIGTSLVIWVVFRMVSGFIDRVKLKEFDRQMGALVGFARGVLWCVAITFFAVTLIESKREEILQSRSGHYIAMLLDKTDAVVPQEIHDVIGPYLDRARTEIDPTRAPEASQPPTGADWPSATPTSQPAPWGAAASTDPTAWPSGSASNDWTTDNGVTADSTWPSGSSWPANDNRVPAQPTSGGW